MKCPSCHKPVPKDRLKCPSCKNWVTDNTSSFITQGDGSVLLCDVEGADSARLRTGPWDAAWGTSWRSKETGIVKVSTTLLGGSPGAGKSTLLLQLCDGAAQNSGREVLYIAAEEAVVQIKDRADRLGIACQNRIRMVNLFSGEGNVEDLLNKYKPALAILDSMNGLVKDNPEAQIRVAQIFKNFAMKYECPAILVSHVNKGGEIAGRVAFQHEVDTTLTFFPVEGDKEEEPPRLLEVEKNRNGQVTAMAFNMTERGLVPFVIDEEKEDEDADES